jgi:hypothetical protein
MHAPDRIPDRLAIADLNSAFCARLDANDIPGLLALFTDGALYVSGERRAEGIGAIDAYFIARTAKGPRTSRHLYSNLLVEFDGADRARGASAVLSFAQDGTPPLPVEPYMVADFTDIYVRDAERGWLIAERIITPVFRRP